MKLVITRGKVETASTPPMCSTDPVRLWTMMARATVDIEVPRLDSP